GDRPRELGDPLVERPDEPLGGWRGTEIGEGKGGGRLGPWDAGALFPPGGIVERGDGWQEREGAQGGGGARGPAPCEHLFFEEPAAPDGVLGSTGVEHGGQGDVADGPPEGGAAGGVLAAEGDLAFETRRQDVQGRAGAEPAEVRAGPVGLAPD